MPDKKDQNYLKLLLARIKPYANILIPLGIILILTYIPMFLSRDMIDLFTQEDKIYETLSAVFFFITSLLYIFAYMRSGKYHSDTHTWLKRRSYLLLALAFFIFAGEEISWGQRIFNTGDSDLIRDINHQNETNIHNLKWIDEKAEVSSFPFSLISAGSLFMLFTLSVWLFIPVIADVHKRANEFFQSFMPVFPWQLFLLMLLNFGLFLGVRTLLRTYPDFYHHTRSLNWSIYEVLEFGMALILLTIAAHLAFVMLAPPKAATPANDKM